MFRHMLLWLVLAQSAGLPALAADGAGNYAIWGVGRTSCHQYLQSAGGTRGEHYKLFLMGYLTAFNTLSEDTYNVTGTRTLDASLAALTEYCADHQMDSFDRAVQQLVAAGYDARHRVPPGRDRGWGRPGLPDNGKDDKELP
jgi:hypothetical protein